MAKPALSAWRVISADYLAFVCVAYPLMLWASYAVLAAIGLAARTNGREDGWFAAGGSAPIFFWLALGLSVGGLPLLVWRLYWLGDVWANGLAVPGKVHKVFFERERGEVEYTYPYGGKVFRRKASLHRTRETRRLQAKDEVLVIVDRRHPERAFLGELFGVGSKPAVNGEER